MLSATLQSEASSRDALITAGLPIVRRVAFRMARRLPASVDVGDLIGAGSEGLMKAADSYDPEAYPRFEPYAERRIKGAILDELRSWDPVTRHGRKRMAEVSRAIKALQARLGRAPEEEEIAEALGMELADYQRLSMELARGPMLGRLGQVEPDHVDSGFDDPASLYGDKELKQRLAKAITKLPERTQQVLALYYQEECTQAEIGQVLGVTESRVCQILGEAAARLRAILAKDERVRRPVARRSA
ncbi:MAG TPA: RNA polymerase sigma factor FliA [Sandaracinaceae bacterium LLY-WYZ-13_1]|nr:RNA polymerase sigma factor FliA [Sandaracinaceae bacterium LLY-WYZ-13_1]